MKLFSKNEERSVERNLLEVIKLQAKQINLLEEGLRDLRRKVNSIQENPEVTNGKK